jgi:hypothetical protein
MVEARQGAAWARTSAIMALLEVAHASKRTKFNPSKWNPYTKHNRNYGRDAQALTKGSIGVLKMFVGSTKKRGRHRPGRSPQRARQRKDPQA